MNKKPEIVVEIYRIATVIGSLAWVLIELLTVYAAITLLIHNVR